MFSATFWHEITLYAIDIDKKRFRTTFLALQNHFENRPSTIPQFTQDLRMTRIKVQQFETNKGRRPKNNIGFKRARNVNKEKKTYCRMQTKGQTAYTGAGVPACVSHGNVSPSRPVEICS